MARLIAILLTLALLALSGGGAGLVPPGPAWAQAEALPEAGGEGGEAAALPSAPAASPLHGRRASNRLLQPCQPHARRQRRARARAPPTDREQEPSP